MPGRRHLPGAHEAIGSGEPTSRHGLLTWWQRRSRRTDLAVLARVRDGLRRLDGEPDGEDQASPRLADTADTADTDLAPASAPPVLGAAPCLDAGYPAEPPALEREACPPAPPPAAPSA